MRFSLFQRIAEKVEQLVGGRGRPSDEFFEELEDILYQADVNVGSAQKLVTGLQTAVHANRVGDTRTALEMIKSDIIGILHTANPNGIEPLRKSAVAPSVYVVVGVNGVGKTTSIAKLAHLLHAEGSSVVLAAADTFRAAAIDQLEVWARRTDSLLVKHREGGDPSAVVFDAIRAARARGADVILADTAGRLHTRANLMEELKKIHRISERELGRPADEVLLVMDATTGQNGIAQAREFARAVPLTGIILTKMDGTAKGGLAISIASEMKIPIKFIGVGERPSDIEPFDPATFTDGLFDRR